MSKSVFDPKTPIKPVNSFFCRRMTWQQQIDIEGQGSWAARRGGYGAKNCIHGNFVTLGLGHASLHPRFLLFRWTPSQFAFSSWISTTSQVPQLNWQCPFSKGRTTLAELPGTMKQESVIVMAEWNVDLEVIAMDGIPGGSHRSPFANANKPLMPRRGCGGPRMQVCWHATYAIEGMPLRGWELAASLCASLSDHLSTHQTPYSAINHPTPSRSMFASLNRFCHSCQRSMSNLSKYNQNSLWVNICLHYEVEGWC